MWRLRNRLALSRFFRGEEASPGPIVLNQRRVFILPNSRGWGLAGLLLIQLLAATNYSNNLAFILSFLMIGIVVLGILHGFRNLAGLELSAARGEPVFAGQVVHFDLYLSNPTRYSRISLQITAEKSTPVMTDVPAETNSRIQVAVSANQRGWLDLPTITVSSCFPLGLFRSWSPNNLAVRTLVYPLPARVGTPFPRLPRSSAIRQNDPDDFRGFQTYQPGDPLRRIHWKGVAKGQGVHVKEYEQGGDGELHFDFAKSAGPVEARLSQLCRWILEAEKAGLRYSLKLPHLSVPAGCGFAQRSRCLEALALFPR